MRRVIIRAIIACGLLAMPLRAFDANAASLMPPGEELAAAEQAITGGRADLGLKALERAASQNSLRAQVRLAEIYREGKVVSADELKACKLFSEAASAHAKIDPKHPWAKMVGEAYRNWALCYVKGFSQPGWNRNMNAAAELFFQAGVIFGDVPAQYELSQLYLSGQGVSQNIKLGIDHLYMTSRKRHPPALARLGHLMWEGKVMKRRAGPGLALLILAKEGAAPEDRAWILSLHDDAMITATRAEEAEAEKFAAEWRNTYGPVPGVAPTNKGGVDDPIPLPLRSPRSAIPIAGEEQRNSFGNQPTGASVLGEPR
jgi:hypothetical protein